MKNSPKKIAIIKVAIRCIAQHGIEGSSADVIARKMGIAQSGIFYYFPQQENIFDSLVEFIAGVNHSFVQKYLENSAPRTPKDALMGHLLGNLNWAAKYPDHVSVLLVSIAKTSRSRMMRERVNRIFQVGEQRIISVVGELNDRGSARELGAFIHQALTGIIVSHYYSRSIRDLKFFERMLVRQTTALLGAYNTKQKTRKHFLHRRERHHSGQIVLK